MSSKVFTSIIEKIKLVINTLLVEYPSPTTGLIYNSPFELLIATILSAQCTDKMVNNVTPQLFKIYSTPQKLANADIIDIVEIIRPTGFFNSKAKKITETSKILFKEYDSKVPLNIDELLTLPGVGRKTANCVIGRYSQPVGIVVDTHVKRLSKRIGFTTKSQPQDVENDLMLITPIES